ncbi:hypothetical protein ACFFMP_08940 [Pseudoroseomonas cervicalis]|uniref:Uncharacterized protein n=1 Tax=Pseudoroseomonas cervicalis ATCC 49957 TaxID=525371 RepID=D5RNU9_9PROT|nr:hypothetical protein [Pseudoroseomonas cervicalis]EFH11019.1 hypothetical protein HMPREF0731_2760 [Pseudoroseomonas cervicalis ATCC 49957]
MFHHRSCGTVQLVALMAAHRALHDAPAPLRQQDVEALLEKLETPPPPQQPAAWQPPVTRSWRS